MANIQQKEASGERNESPPPAPAETTGEETGFIHHEPPMSYQPPEKALQATTSPVHEPGPRMVTPLNRLGAQAADVDCPYCKKVVKTIPRQVSSGDDGMMMCLICLVCWPLLCCYEGDKDTNHYCSVCNRQLTHQAKGTGPVQVVASTDAQPGIVPSKYEQAS